MPPPWLASLGNWSSDEALGTERGRGGGGDTVCEGERKSKAVKITD